MPGCKHMLLNIIVLCKQTVAQLVRRQHMIAVNM